MERQWMHHGKIFCRQEQPVWRVAAYLLSALKDKIVSYSVRYGFAHTQLDSLLPSRVMLVKLNVGSRSWTLRCFWPYPAPAIYREQSEFIDSCCQRMRIRPLGSNRHARSKIPINMVCKITVNLVRRRGYTCETNHYPWLDFEWILHPAISSELLKEDIWTK
jgi:hypothetical protein